MEGSGSEAVQMNYRSRLGSRRPKNIRIQIKNTRFRCVVLKSGIRATTMNSLTEQLWERGTLSQQRTAAWSSFTKGSLLSTEGKRQFNWTKVGIGKKQLAWSGGVEKEQQLLERSSFLEHLWEGGNSQSWYGEEAGDLSSSGKEQLTWAASVRSIYSFSFERRTAYFSWCGYGSSCGKEYLTIAAWERSSFLEVVRGEGAAYLLKSPGKSSLAEQLKNLTWVGVCKTGYPNEQLRDEPDFRHLAIYENNAFFYPLKVIYEWNMESLIWTLKFQILSVVVHNFLLKRIKVNSEENWGVKCNVYITG